MATYYMAGKATWPGAWASVYTDATSQTTPGTAKNISDWLDAGSIVSGDTVILLGTYPLTLADTADFTANTVAANTALSNSGTANRTKDGAYGRNLIFGNDHDNTSGSPSSVTGVTFIAQGDVGGWNVDMTGATSNDDRQLAALFFQGYDVVVDGFKVKCSDYNYAKTGGIAAVGTTDYITDFPENMGIYIRGGWGCEVKNCVVNGGTRGNYGIKVEYRASTTATFNANKSILIHDNEVYNCGEGGIDVEGGAGINASSAMPLPNGALIAVYNNIVRDAFWGEASWNAARRHGNLIAVYAGAQNGSAVKVYGNDISGECQDALLAMCGFAMVYDNHIHDIMPGVDFSDTVDVLYGIASPNPGYSTLAGYADGWDVRTMTEPGNCIKVGLGNSYTGTEPAEWLTPGTAGGTYNIDQFRPIVYGNVIDSFSAYGVTTNGSGGQLIFGNEIRSTRGRGIYCAGGSTTEPVWVANNYVECPRALIVSDYVNVYAFNNCLKGSTFSAVESGANNAVYGSNNLLDGSTSGTFLWVNNTSATAGYTWGTGPTSGGNCDGTGEWFGLIGARVPSATAFDIAGKRWKQARLPIGPRQP